MREAPNSYDVVVIGGAFSGASCALLLRRWLPESRILVVERSEVFDRKVGEATVELSALFMHRVLRMADFLAREQLPKHGLRFWLSDGGDRLLSEMTEIGPGEVPRLPAYQLERAVLDQHILDTARNEGVEVMRPAKVAAVDLGWPESTLTLESASTPENGAPGNGSRTVPFTVKARWVVDASGRHAFLARRLRIQHRVEEHPIAALWGRWRGVADLDGPEVLGSDPRAPRIPQVAPSRQLATNHFCGYGWWCWVIPLASGETSIGVVYDKTLAEPPGATPIERYEDFVRSRPGLRELIAGATLDRDDFRGYRHLPYRVERYADRGWALVGDAASFMDPFYSPGLDHAGVSAFATARMIEDDLTGRLADDDAVAAAVETHNAVFERSYGRWLHALYVGKYRLMGDAELLACAYLVETALYYMAIVHSKYRDTDHMRYPPYGEGIWQEAVAWRMMRAFNRRLQILARQRRERGIYGRRNLGWRLYGNAPGSGLGGVPMLRSGLRLWLRLEIGTLWARLTRKRRSEDVESRVDPARLREEPG
jgi:flavin-dependent dehydrogenase